MFNRLSVFALYASCVASPALAHLHINMEAPATDEGTPLEISFYGSETFGIVDVDGRLEFQDNSTIYTVTADTQVGSQYESLIPGLEGYQRGGMANFTTDGLTTGVQNLKAPGDRTVDADSEPYGYQIFDVVDIETGESLSDDYHVLWQLISEHDDELGLPGEYNGYQTLSADSAGVTTLEQTYILPLGTHTHGGANSDSGFFLFTDAPIGEYDVSLRAVDLGGYFEASAPVTLRLNVVPEPTSVALVTLGGIALIRRRR